MPYANERASRLGHVDVANSTAVSAALGKYTIIPAGQADHRKVFDNCVALSDLASDVNAGDITRAVSIDGSNLEVPVKEDFPSVRTNFIQIAAVATDVGLLRELSEQPLVDPARLVKAHTASRIDAVLPGSGLTLHAMTGKQSWRREVDALLRNTPFDHNSSTSIADLLAVLHSESDLQLPIRSCPECAERFSDDKAPRVGLTSGRTFCPACEEELLLADALRISDDYNDAGENAGPTNRVMNLVERLIMIGYIDEVATTGPEALNRTAFFTDGPLALFGSTAPLKRRMSEYLDSVATTTGAMPLLVGLEKTGAFADHANMLQRMDLVAPGQVMMVTNEYANWVTGRAQRNLYGVDEFYGRRFIYRASGGEVFVLTAQPSPGVDPYSSSRASEDFASYPTLRPICETIDMLGTKLFANAVIPVALAHKASSLPLGVGRSVLTALAQQGLGLPPNSRLARRGAN